jgi:two-component system NtrC family response regulator
LPYEVKFGPSVLEVNNKNRMDLAYIEKKHIERVLQIVKGNKTKAARMLNIGLSTLYRKLNDYEIQLQENEVNS